MTFIRLAGASLVFLSIMNCNSAFPDPATVQFKVDAPFCGPRKLQFLIDLNVVGNETLSQGQTSRVFTTTLGPHDIRAVASTGFTQDTVVTLTAGETLILTYSEYCS